MLVINENGQSMMYKYTMGKNPFKEEQEVLDLPITLVESKFQEEITNTSYKLYEKLMTGQIFNYEVTIGEEDNIDEIRSNAWKQLDAFKLIVKERNDSKINKFREE